MLVGDGLGPEYSQDSFKVLGVESGQFVDVAFSHPEPCIRVESMQQLHNNFSFLYKLKMKKHRYSAVLPIWILAHWK